MTQTSNGEFVEHRSCPECSSSDALGVYSNGTGWCFSCNTFFKEIDGMQAVNTTDKLTVVGNKVDLLGRPMAIIERGISLDTVKKYNVHIETQANSSEPKTHYYPYYDKHGKLIGAKVRGVADKSFRAQGDMRNNTLFGAHLFKNEGRYVTVVEGELDALAAYEMLGSKWAVVSVSKGAAGAVKDFKQNLEWLEGFENVVICFDSDEAGRDAAQKCAEVLSPNKAKIVHLTDYKDASDYLANGRGKNFTNEWWEAKTYRVAGVITLEEAWESFKLRGTEEIIPFPECFGNLNPMMNGGISAGEITVLGALTSVGKTTYVNEIVYHLWKNTDKRIGCAFLEASSGEAIENLLTIHTGVNLALADRETLNYDELHCDIITDGRISLLDHQGAVGTDDLFLKLRAMVKGNGCDILVIDPLQAAVTANTNEVIDEVMDRFLKLAKETNVSIIIVSHMRKPNVKDAHDVSEYDLKGSGSINQIAFNTILLSRDKMAEDDIERNSTKVQLVKCRRTGITGNAGWVYYNMQTGRLSKGEEPKVSRANEEDEF